MKPRGHYSLEPFENRNKLWMLHNLHVLSPIQLGGLQSWVSTILHYIHSMNQLHFCLFNPPIQSFDSLTAERKWTNLTRVILSESSIHRCLKTLNSPDDTLDTWWYTYAYGISFNLERKPKEKRQFQTAQKLHSLTNLVGWLYATSWIKGQIFLYQSFINLPETLEGTTLIQ